MLAEASLPSLLSRPHQIILPSVISVLASTELLLLFHRTFSWFLVWRMVFDGNVVGVCVIIRLWISFKPVREQAGS